MKTESSVRTDNGRGMGSQKQKEKQRREGRTRGNVRFGERMKNKPRRVGDKTAHWPRVRLTMLLVARPFLPASGQPGHFCHQKENGIPGRAITEPYVYNIYVHTHTYAHIIYVEKKA